MEPTFAKLSRFAIATFCDDVRTEIGNKLSLIGVYQSDLLVPGFPVTLPKFCVVLIARTPLIQPFKELTFEVLRNDEVLTSVAADPERLTAPPNSNDEHERYWGAMFVSAMAPFPITEEFVLRTQVRTESEILKGGALMIKRFQADLPPPATS